MKAISLVATLLIVCVIVCVLHACGDPKPAVQVSDVQLVAPAPGRAVSVAYLSIENSGASDITLTRISSPQFRSAELHETSIDNGVAMMRPLSSVVVHAGSSVAFAPGGKHVMLMDPVRALTPGSAVSLQVYFDTGEILIVETTVSTRMEVR